MQETYDSGVTLCALKVDKHVLLVNQSYNVIARQQMGVKLAKTPYWTLRYALRRNTEGLLIIRTHTRLGRQLDS